MKHVLSALLSEFVSKSHSNYSIQHRELIKTACMERSSLLKNKNVAQIVQN